MRADPSQTLALEEADWLAQARRGDAAAFAAIYRRYEPSIYRFVYRCLGSPEDAQDLTQDTFVKAYVALPRTAGPLNLAAWLYQIARNGCRDVWRHRRLIHWLSWEEGEPVALAQRVLAEPEDYLLAEETAAEIQRILQQLPPRYRRGLLLKEYQGLSYREIAQALETTPEAIKALLSRAREGFRQIAARDLPGALAPRHPVGANGGSRVRARVLPGDAG